MAGRRGVGIFLAAVILVGCGTAPSASPSGPIAPSPSFPAGTPDAPSVEPTVLPTSTPPAASPGIVCPSDLATTVGSVEELADPSCYGSTELTIDGWLAESGVWLDPSETRPAWTNPWIKLYATYPTAGQFMIDFMHADQVPGGIDVVTPPRTGIDLSGNGRWVRLRGHFNDAAASACEQVRTSGSERECPDLFVATGFEDRPLDSPVCPAGEPISIETFLAADARCFRGRDVKLRGWEDIGEGFGGTGPIWRVDESASLRLADAQLAAARFEELENEPYLFVWTAKGLGVRFDASDRQVVVTARLGHPAARDCVPEQYDDWDWAPPVTWAQHYCERMLVITDVRSAN